MSDPADNSKSGEGYGELSREEEQSVLFAQLVIQQANMAMLLMGKSPHPQGGELPRDLDGARLFIDQLEVLELKTKGNLSKDEQALLTQNLMALRLAFVEAVEAADKPAGSASTNKAVAEGKSEALDQKETAPTEAGAGEDTESKKRFTKKFSL